MPPLRFISLLAVLCALLTAPSRAQIDAPDPDDVESEIERAVEISGEESADDSDRPDELERYRAAPIDLYTTTADALTRLPGLSLQDALVILEFVDRVSPTEFERFEELQGLNRDQIATLRAYTTLKRAPIPAERPTRIDVRCRIAADLQPRAGYRDNLYRVVTRRAPAGDSLGLDTISIGHSYLGGPEAILTRLTVSAEGFTTVLLFEKDAGESILTRDTLSYAYNRYERIDPLLPVGDVRNRLGAFVGGTMTADLGPATLTLGDYNAEFGQGLILWGGFGGLKGGDVIRAPYKSGRGITGHRSSSETRFLRGAALVLDDRAWLPSKFTAVVMLSARDLDASITTITNADGETVEAIGSIRSDGYRRTRSELRRSETARESLLGASLRREFDGGHVALTGYVGSYGLPFAPDLHYERAGDRVTMLGLDWRWSSAGASFFGEIARSTDGTPGGIVGLTTSLRGAILTVAGRWLPATFDTPHGVGFGESPVGQRNERGLYIGLKTTIAPRLTFAAYGDIYAVPERTFTVPFPHDGADGMMEILYQLSPRLRIAARLRSERKGDATTQSDAYGREPRLLLDRTSSSARLDIGYSSVGGRLRARFRFERRHVSYSEFLPSADGILTSLTARYEPDRTISLAAALALFRTDGFDAALYVAAQDVPGRVTGTPLYGEGERLSLSARWRPTPSISLSVSYAELVYVGRDIISPGGLQEIRGSVHTVLAAQVDISLSSD